MDPSFHSARPGSCRPQSRFNPITGEDMTLTKEFVGNHFTTTAQETYRDHSQTKLSQHTTTRPNGVPRLNLKHAVSRDDDGVKDHTFMMDMKHHSAAEASSRSGTSRNFDQPPVWNKAPTAAVDLPLPSQRQKDQHVMTEREARESHRSKVAPVNQMHGAERDMARLRLKLTSDDGDDDCESVRSEPADQLQYRLYSDWKALPYSKEASEKLHDKELLEGEKRKSKMLETVLIDQLCRPVMSDPAQDASYPTSVRVPQCYQPGMKRGTVRVLHDTKVKTDGSATENLLSRRVRFEARILSLIGRDATRELTGFFFAADNSLTVYEFRQFGKASKAMPFVKRGRYCRLRDGQPTSVYYNLADIIQGTDIELLTADQPVPDCTKSKPIMVLRICNVDNEAKKSILLSGVPDSKAFEMWKRLQLPTPEDEYKAFILRRSIHETVRRQIGKRGIKVYTGIGRLLRRGDLNNDGLINKFELEKSLTDFRVDVPQDKFDDLWDILDPESSNFLQYDLFMRSFIGEMNEYRKSYVIKAFIKMDSGKRGSVSFGDVRKFYNAHKHPKVKSGECTDEQIIAMFFGSFETTTVKNELSFREFEEYYEGLSLSMDNDDEFVNILQNSWSI